jgi:hypothetical protein
MIRTTTGGSNVGSDRNGPPWHVRMAFEAMDEGYRVINNRLADAFVKAGNSFRLPACDLHEGDNIRNAARRFTIAFEEVGGPGVRLAVKTEQIYPWTLGRVEGPDRPPDLVGVADWQLDHLERMYGFIASMKWDADRWQQCVVEQRAAWRAEWDALFAGPDASPLPRGRKDGRPSSDRQDDIITTILLAKMPLTRPELVEAMKLESEGKLGANLAWMTANNVLINIKGRGYWPVGYPVPV